LALVFKKLNNKNMQDYLLFKLLLNILIVVNMFKGGATIEAGKDMSPALLRDVPRIGYNPVYVVHLRSTTAGR